MRVLPPRPQVEAATLTLSELGSACVTQSRSEERVLAVHTRGRGRGRWDRSAISLLGVLQEALGVRPLLLTF